MPVLNVVDVLVAVSFGALVFHETPEHTPVIVLARCLALACLAIGLTQIARLGSRPSRSVALTTPERPFS
jgi:uncharacterized membrane protein YqgA involved in biofilm formation